MKLNWISIYDLPPPDEDVLIKDEFERRAIGRPTYYSFHCTKGLSGQIIIHYVEPYWDGGWLIEVKGINVPDIGKITHYSLIR